MTIHIKYVLTLLLVGVSTIMLWGGMDPWPPAREILSAYPDQQPVLVGASHSVRSHGSFGPERMAVRQYILLPSVFVDPKALTIRQRNEEKPIVHETLTVLFVLVPFYVALAFFAARSWFPHPEAIIPADLVLFPFWPVLVALAVCAVVMAAMYLGS